MSQSTPRLSRRTLFAGASAVGAAAAIASLIPAGQDAATTAAQAPKAAPEKGGGYTLSDHVKQYYKTTRV